MSAKYKHKHFFSIKWSKTVFLCLALSHLSLLSPAINAKGKTACGSNKELTRLGLLDIGSLLKESITTTGTRSGEKTRNVPAALSVITAEDIAIYGYQSVAEALSHVTGFVETNDLVQHNFGVRGIHPGLHAGNRTIKVMINNQPISFRSTSQQFIGLELIPMSLIEKIEIIRGPASASYGANAFLGVVNIITHSGSYFKDNCNRVSLSGEYIEAAQSGLAAELSMGHADNDIDYSLGISASYQNRAGLELPQRSPLYTIFEKGQGNRLIQSEQDSSQPRSFYLRSTWDASQQRQLGVSLYHQVLEADNNFSDLSPLRQMGVSRVALSNSFMRLDWQEKWNKQWTSNAYFSVSRGDTLEDDRVEVGAADNYLERELGYTAIETGLESIVQVGKYNTLLFGVDYSHEKQKLEHFSRVNRATQILQAINVPKTVNMYNQGLYLQWQHRFMQKWLDSQWHLTLGYRFDKPSHTQNQSSMRIGLVGDLPKGKVIKLLFGSAFQAPSPELLFRKAVQGGDIEGNPNLKAQEVDTAELSLSVPFLDEKLYLTGTVFYSKIKNLVQYQSIFTNILARNSSASNTKGIEIEARYKNKAWDLYGNLLWQDTQVDDNPFNLFVLNEREKGDLFPNLSLNAGISYYWKRYKFRAALDNRYVGKRPASTQNVGLAQRFYSIKAHLDSTLTLSTQKYTLIKGKPATLRFQIRDLWDQQYVNPGFGGIDIPTLGRRYMITFSQKF